MTQQHTESVPSTVTSAGSTVRWEIDPTHSSITFGVRHMMVSTVRGEFETLSGHATWDPKDPERSRVEVTIDAASINTRDERRDAHLRSADFFDVERFPTLEFRSKSIGRRDAGGLAIVGDLTIHGVTRAVTLDVEGPTEEWADPWGSVRLGASATTKIKRSDFGMVWNTALEAGGFLVGDEVKIQLDIQLKRTK